jgi:hypothetical protein
MNLINIRNIVEFYLISFYILCAVTYSPSGQCLLFHTNKNSSCSSEIQHLRALDEQKLFWFTLNVLTYSAATALKFILRPPSLIKQRRIKHHMTNKGGQSWDRPEYCIVYFVNPSHFQHWIRYCDFERYCKPCTRCVRVFEIRYKLVCWSNGRGEWRGEMIE